jgi:hypothetical protein
MNDIQGPEALFEALHSLQKENAWQKEEGQSGRTSTSTLNDPFDAAPSINDGPAAQTSAEKEIISPAAAERDSGRALSQRKDRAP